MQAASSMERSPIHRLWGGAAVTADRSRRLEGDSGRSLAKEYSASMAARDSGDAKEAKWQSARKKQNDRVKADNANRATSLWGAPPDEASEDSPEREIRGGAWFTMRFYSPSIDQIPCGSPARRKFDRDLIRDLSVCLEIRPDRILILDIKVDSGSKKCIVVEVLFYEMWSRDQEAHPTVARIGEVMARFSGKKTSPLFRGAVTKNNDPFHKIHLEHVEDAAKAAGELDRSHIPQEVLTRQQRPKNRPNLEPVSPDDVADSYLPKKEKHWAKESPSAQVGESLAKERPLRFLGGGAAGTSPPKRPSGALTQRILQ